MIDHVLNAEVRAAAPRILAVRASVPVKRAALIAISGIDGSGKGFVTSLLEAELANRGCKVATINIDGWLQLPSRRFDPTHPAEHFYAHGIRFRELFDELVLPLRSQRSIDTMAHLADATNRPTYRTQRVAFTNVDVILLEGIFLLKRELCRHFDFSLWIDCTFDTALERALARNQEGLPAEDIVRDYATIYFAAQRLHFERDTPREAASVVIVNDDRLAKTARNALVTP